MFRRLKRKEDDFRPHTDLFLVPFVASYTFHANMEKNPVELITFSSIYLEGPPHGFNVLALPQDLSLPKGVKLVNGVSPKLLLHKDPKYHHPSDGFLRSN